MIRGYARRPSVMPGRRLILHIATDAPRFRVHFHRVGDGFTHAHSSDWLAGKFLEDGKPDADWHWPDYAFDIPKQWPSGVYVAHLEESNNPRPLAMAMDSAAILFVVRGLQRSAMLYKLPFATYHAYNCTGGGCFYFQPPRSNDPPGAKLTWHRPGGGIGGETFGALDHYDLGSPRQTFAHWDAPFIRWMSRRGYDVEFCADIDVHDDLDFLTRHRLILSVGHDEYWTASMREHIDAYRQSGGNLAFFGANVCWWRIHLVDDASAMVCHQGGPNGALDHWWPITGVHHPEDALTGVSYRHGGGWWDGPRDTQGFVVQRGDHWVFHGTGLRSGDRFGHRSTPPLVGYECDGAPLEWIDEARGLVRVAANASECGTPKAFVPLAVGVLGTGWQEKPHREHYASGAGLHSATLGLHWQGGTVFCAGTTDWAQVLANGSDPHVATITTNVIETLSEPAALCDVKQSQAQAC
ncbi:MAG TPA: N,N-dimethylformamidase beta subunit family domain-containing protein [Burkholderiaceae bacterium]|nr:N,N-dimethylformamidase beta subunit family domain-containing protein [Burkholderiaceae bacterium]